MSALQALSAHPDAHILNGFSLEITAKDIAALRAAAPAIPLGTPVSITYLPGESLEARIAAVAEARALGFEPVPHYSARRLGSDEEFSHYLAESSRAGAQQAFVVAGDASVPDGPFADSTALIATGSFERAGVTVLGVGGHPEGHAHMTEQQCWDVLAAKCADITHRGMTAMIVTQFAFDADHILRWLAELRARGIDAPVRLGVPGPASIKTLMRFALRCGVGASTAVLSKYGISIGKLLGSTGPDRLVETLVAALTPQHGNVTLHFYPFGGIEKTVTWINDYIHAR